MRSTLIRTCFLLLFSALATNPKSAFSAPSCDFNGDRMSEFVFVNVNGSGNYDWTSFNPRNGRVQSIVQDFGNRSSKLIPGNWVKNGEAVAAIVNPVAAGANGRAVWMVKSDGYDGGAIYSRFLGRSGDIVIQGGDYDGNGVADSLILKRTTGKLGLRVDYFLSSYNGNNLGTERLYKALGRPFKDRNFFFSPNGVSDYLAVLQKGASGNLAIQLRPFTDLPKSISLGSLPGGSLGPLALKEGSGSPDLLAFYAPRGNRTLLTVKTLKGVTVFCKTVSSTGLVTVGDYFNDKGWEIAIWSGENFTIVNPVTKVVRLVHGPTGQLVSCVSNQTID